MTTPFPTWRHAAGFSILIAVLLGLPWIAAKTGRFDRRDAYDSAGWNAGPFPWIKRQVFEETNAVDMVFLGSSVIWADIRARFVQARLSDALGRDANVITIGWSWSGYDAVYFIAKDFIERRRPRVLVVYDELIHEDAPHVEAPQWFRWGEDSSGLSGLSTGAKWGLYGSSVLGVPRRLLSALRPNRIESAASWPSNDWHARWRVDDLVAERGALRCRLAFGDKPDFSPYAPPDMAAPPAGIVYGAGTRSAFSFVGDRLGPYETQFVELLRRLCEERGTKLVVLHLPFFSEFEETSIEVRGLAPELFDGAVRLVGIPPARMFAGLGARDVRRLYHDNGHMNANGQDYFTGLITPTLVDLYGKDK